MNQAPRENSDVEPRSYEFSLLRSKNVGLRRLYYELFGGMWRCRPPATWEKRGDVLHGSALRRCAPLCLPLLRPDSQGDGPAAGGGRRLYGVRLSGGQHEGDAVAAVVKQDVTGVFSGSVGGRKLSAVTLRPPTRPVTV